MYIPGSVLFLIVLLVACALSPAINELVGRLATIVTGVGLALAALFGGYLLWLNVDFAAFFSQNALLFWLLLAPLVGFPVVLALAKRWNDPFWALVAFCGVVFGGLYLWEPAITTKIFHKVWWLTYPAVGLVGLAAVLELIFPEEKQETE